MGKKKIKKIQNDHSASPELKRLIKEKYKDVVDFCDAPDEMRMSDKMMRLIEPFVESMDDIILLLDCATIAWNECLDEDFEIKGSYSLNNALINYAKYRELIDELKLRKRVMFKGTRRHIKEAKFYQEGMELSLNVVSESNIKDVFSGMSWEETDAEPYETYSEADDEEFYEAIESYEDDGDISKPNPYLKHTLLEVVDNQLRGNDPPITRKTFERLQAEGYTAKQAKEKIAAVLVEDIYEIMTTKKAHDAAAYERKLKALT